MLSPGKGLLWYNPLLWAALVAWPAFCRRDRAEALLVAAVVLGQLAFYASWFLWWAGHGWGPRFLVSALPFAVLPLAPLLESVFRAPVSRRRLAAGGLALLALISIAVQALGVVVDFNHYLNDVYAELGLYHPATLFDPAYSPLVRQVAYLEPRYLDLAWARGGVFRGPAFLFGLLAVLLSALSFWSAGRRRIELRTAVALHLILVLVSVRLLILYAPAGDVAQAARMLTAMEQPGEALALTKSVLTEPFQDGYDGHLPVWGVPSRAEVGGEPDAVWTLGPGASEPALFRFQVGDVQLALHRPVGEVNTDRLPLTLLQEEPVVGGVAELVALDLGPITVRPGDPLSLTLAWRARAPVSSSLTVFVQAIDQGGIKVAQIDWLPCSGGCPTSSWRVGDIVVERYVLDLHPDAPPGAYRLIVGMYDLITHENLSWVGGDGQPLGPHLPLAVIVVEP